MVQLGYFCFTLRILLEPKNIYTYDMKADHPTNEKTLFTFRTLIQMSDMLLSLK